LHIGSFWKYLRERDHLEGIGIDGRTMKIDLKKTGQEGMDWIYLAQDRDKWRDVVSTVMDLRVA
jgi:hypothetical protein